MNKPALSQTAAALVMSLCLVTFASSALRSQAAEPPRETVPAAKPQRQLDQGKDQGWEVKPPCVLSNMSTCPPGTEDFDSLDLMPLHLLGIPEGYRSAVKPKGAR